MCCIIYKPKGVQMPSLDTLAKIKKLNHNGYGFVSTGHFHKGLDYRTFLRHLSEVGDDEDCIIHFRLATQGSICRANCHPFEKDGVYFAHNGVLRTLPVNDMTDSEIVFRYQIYPDVIQRLLKRHIPYFLTREEGDMTILCVSRWNLFITSSAKAALIPA